MQVIFIGPDGSGKTGASEVAAIELQVERHKAVALKDDKLTLDTTLTYLAQLQRTDDIVIWDRWHYPDDVIYNPIVAKRSSSLSRYWDIIEIGLNAADTLLIFMTASTDTLSKRVGRRGDDYINVSMLDRIKNGYDIFLGSTKLPYRIIDTTDINSRQAKEQAIHYILEFYEERNGVPYASRNYRTN